MRTVCRFGFARSRRGGSHFADVKGLLKYLQYRDDRDGHIPGAGGPDRWVDGGLGRSYPEILRRLDALNRGNRRAYCHFVVVSPDPQAMAQVQGDPQARFVQAVEATVQAWEEWRQRHDATVQAGPLEYSFVVHRPERNYGEQMHAHLVLAAATESPMTRETTPLYNNRPEIEAFREINARQLDVAFGLDRKREETEPGLEPEHEGPEYGTFDEREIEFIRFFEQQAAEGAATEEAGA
jgi:hypothetical protein